MTCEKVWRQRFRPDGARPPSWTPTFSGWLPRFQVTKGYSRRDCPTVCLIPAHEQHVTTPCNLSIARHIVTDMEAQLPPADHKL